MIRRLIAAVTCLSCGAPLGQPHNPGCEFSHHGADLRARIGVSA